MIIIDPPTTEKVVFWLGETKGFWVQTGALLISAAGGILIILSRSRTERRRATVDVVLHQKSDSELVQAKRQLFKLHDDGHQNFAAFLANKDSPEYQAIFKVLNGHEFIAAGIRRKAYDEQLFKRMQCSTVLRDWNALSGFIMEFRNIIKSKVSYPDTFYQDFEWLATKWTKDPLKPSKR